MNLQPTISKAEHRLAKRLAKHLPKQLIRRALACCVPIVLSLGACARTAPDRYYNKSDIIDMDTSPDSFFDGESDYTSAAFETHLPLVIIDKDGARLSIADYGEANRTDSEPVFASSIELHTLRYENDDPRPKEDYFFTISEDAAVQPLLGMGARSRWFLLGGMYDKSLIRNYLGYALSSAVLKDAPETRFCELLLKQGERYLYQGVYLLVQGSGERDTVAFRRTEHYWAGLNQTVVADDYAGMFVLQPDWGGGGEKSVSAAGKAITDISGMFYSRDTDAFLHYSDILNDESFIEYFLINEIMANYEGMNEPVYTYDPASNEISSGPIWNFERALDNQRDTPLNIKQIMYQNAPFYRFMIRDGEFINNLIGTSKKNAAPHSREMIIEHIDRAVLELGPARLRDWRRWGYFYFAPDNALLPEPPPTPAPTDDDEAINPYTGLGRGENGELLVEVQAETYEPPQGSANRARQFTDYSQEITKLKYFAHTRPAYVRRAITLLKNQEGLLGKVNAYGLNTALAVTFFAVLSISIALARRTAGR